MSETRRLCGVPSERRFVLPGQFPGLAPWAGMRCPFRAWGRNWVRTYDWKRVDIALERNRHELKKSFGETFGHTFGAAIVAGYGGPGFYTAHFTRRSRRPPHNLRVSDIEPGTPYAVFLQNTPILWDAVPRAMPWAGMQYPFRVYYEMTVSDTVFDRCGLGANE